VEGTGKVKWKSSAAAQATAGTKIMTADHRTASIFAFRTSQIPHHSR
jgi:hypothetical protein